MEKQNRCLLAKLFLANHVALIFFSSADGAVTCRSLKRTTLTASNRSVAAATGHPGSLLLPTSVHAAMNLQMQQHAVQFARVRKEINRPQKCNFLFPLK